MILRSYIVKSANTKPCERVHVQVRRAGGHGGLIGQRVLGLLSYGSGTAERRSDCAWPKLDIFPPGAWLDHHAHTVHAPRRGRAFSKADVAQSGTMPPGPTRCACGCEPHDDAECCIANRRAPESLIRTHSYARYVYLGRRGSGTQKAYAAVKASWLQNLQNSSDWHETSGHPFLEHLSGGPTRPQSCGEGLWVLCGGANMRAPLRAASGPM